MVSRRLSTLPNSVILDFLKQIGEVERKNPDRKIARFDVGQPGFDTPNKIKLAAINALEEGRTRYDGIAQGTPELRVSIADRTNQSFNTAYTPKNVLICPGSVAGLYAAIGATCDPRDEILLTDPSWEIYSTQAQFQGVRPVFVNLDKKRNWAPDLNDLEQKITPRTRAMIINSPSNPTGTLFSPTDIEQIAKILAERAPEAYLIADEVYVGLTFDQTKCYSASKLPEQYRSKLLIINSFSKTHAMAGWRLGYVLGPEDMISQMEKAARIKWICVPPFIQDAGIMTGDVESEVAEMREAYKYRKNCVMDCFRKEGIPCAEPQGGFYAFPEVGGDSMKLAMYLLREHHVAVIPGVCFGGNGEGHIRLSFGQIPSSEIPAAMDKLLKGITDYSKLK